jgi:hypothetical protein
MVHNVSTNTMDLSNDQNWLAFLNSHQEHNIIGIQREIHMGHIENTEALQGALIIAGWGPRNADGLETIWFLNTVEEYFSYQPILAEQLMATERHFSTFSQDEITSWLAEATHYQVDYLVDTETQGARLELIRLWIEAVVPPVTIDSMSHFPALGSEGVDM